MIKAVIELEDGRILKGDISNLQYVCLENPEMWNFGRERFEKMRTEFGKATFYYTIIRAIRVAFRKNI